MEILEIKNLSFKYGQEKENTLDNINFSVKRGEFVTVFGKTGSGKSTLLRLIKREISPGGEKSGEIFFSGKEILELDEYSAAAKIGFVSQYPEEQIVTDKVWHEIAFGLENLGVDNKTMQRRVAEVAQYFGIGHLFDKRVSELSGGQKQLVALASVMVMNPDVILLDEPTSQLDPIGAAEFISILQRLCREIALTVIITEHRLEELIGISDKLLVLENGKVRSFGEPKKVAYALKDDRDFYCFMPSAVRLFSRLNGHSYDCPLDVRSGRAFVEHYCENRIRSLDSQERERSKNSVIKAKNLCFRYGRELPDVLDGLDLDIREGEFYTVLGGNGSGKTTALGAIAGINKCYSGKIEIFGKKIEKYRDGSLYKNCVAMLSQDVNALFTRDTVREELVGAGVDLNVISDDMKALLGKHPYDISGGQRQMLALYMVTASRPRILLLDEPTKGLDALAKQELVKFLKDLCKNKITVVAVTHDVEFASEASDRVALFFAGRIVSEDTPHSFFSKNNFYTTAVSRMTRGYFDNAVSVEDAVSLCKQNKRRE